LRRALHAQPELSGGEYATRDALVAELRSLGFDPQIFPDHAGIVALWPGSGNGGCLALRADMDALPLGEESGLEWASRRAGSMHACGHDGHMAILMGVAKWLHREGRKYPKAVKLLFQPAEETGVGAPALIAAGALANPEVEAVFGLHGWPELPIGGVAAPDRAVMAAVDNFDLTLRGQGGHGAMPHLARDPVVAAANIISQAQTLVSRRAAPWEPAVLTFGSIVAGETYNVIPETCRLKGTLRTLDPQRRLALRGDFETLIRQGAAAHGISAELKWIESCPPTVNHPAMAALVRAAAQEALGAECLHESPPSMGGEDFAFFLEKVPGAYFWLGLGMERGPLHNPRFDFNDAALASGIAVYASLIERYMKT
jgi:amidohydrolase